MKIDKKQKCKHCGKEIPKVDIKDHEKECVDNPRAMDTWLQLFGVLFIISIIINIFLISQLNHFGIFLLIYSLFILLLYTEKKKAFIINIKIYLWLIIISSLIRYIINFLYSYYNTSSCLFAIIWLIYFYNSEKVKTVFINETTFFNNLTKYIKKTKERIKNWLEGEDV